MKCIVPYSSKSTPAVTMLGKGAKEKQYTKSVSKLEF